MSSDYGQAMQYMMNILLTSALLAGAALIAIPAAIYAYNKKETITTIPQKNLPPIIKTTERFRSDRFYVPIQTTSSNLEYVTLDKYLSSLEVLDKTKRVQEESRIKELLKRQ
jgi:hypothetical protein